MDLRAKGFVADTCQSVVDTGGVRVIEVEGVEVFWAETGYTSDVEYRGGVNEPLVDLSRAGKHTISVGVVGHLEFDIFRRHRDFVAVDNVEGDVLRPVVHFETTGDGRLWARSDLDADRVSLPGVVKADRAFVC